MKKMRNAKKGELIAITTGSYSDYCLCYIAIVEKDFSPDDLEIEFNKENGKPFDCKKFIEWLLSKNFIKEVPHLEINTESSYWDTKDERLRDFWPEVNE